MPDVNHDTYDHAGVTGVPAAEAFDETAHDAHDHTGIPGVGGGEGGTDWAANLFRDIGTMDYCAATTANKFSGASNRMTAVAFMPKKSFTCAAVYGRVVTQNGNLDIGIYDSGRTKLASTGSFACPAAGNFAQAISYALVAGTLYYLAYMGSGTTATAYGSGGVSIVVGSTLGWYYDVGAFPLPAGPVTPTGTDPGTGAIVGLWLE